MALAALALLLPATATAEGIPDPDTIPATARALADGTVRLAVVLGDAAAPGDVLPVCEDHDGPPENAQVVGLIHTESCFEPLADLPSEVTTDDLPTTCDPIHAGVIIGGDPPAYADPDELCIQAILWSLLGKSMDSIPASILVVINR